MAAVDQDDAIMVNRSAPTTLRHEAWIGFARPDDRRQPGSIHCHGALAQAWRPLPLDLAPSDASGRMARSGRTRGLERPACPVDELLAVGCAPGKPGEDHTGWAQLVEWQPRAGSASSTLPGTAA